MKGITVVTKEESFLETAAAAPPGARVPFEVRITVSDPFEAYRRARDTDADGFYLETTGGQSGWGYFGVEPVERLQVNANATPLDADSSSIEAIDSLLNRERLVRGECDVPYPCGAFGWLSYDIARELEDLPATTVGDGLPRLQLGVFDRVAAWEEPRDDDVRIRVTACPVVEGSPEAAYEEGREKATALARAALRGEGRIRSPPTPTRQATFESECGRAAFADRVRTIKRYIRDGDTFQTNVSHRLVAPAAVGPVETFDAVRRVNPAPYSALLEFPGVDLVSASPELLLDVDGDRVVTEPIAGTRPRGGTPEEDAELEADLLADEKERAEHAMLVDLERNDLGKVSEYGSVDVAEYRRVDRYSEVMHLVSLVEGRSRDGVGVADAVAAVFPGGTITGAPKPRTMEIIDEVETTRRGPYTGSIGVFGFDDRATLNITIRTLVHHRDEYRLRVGSGVVHDSVPEREYEETLDKARALVTAVDEALGEQGSFAVDTGTDAMEGVR
ncbi:anthranilate synthase component I family protein [Haladaptatus salinisoli]|uniref:anthranilate synthase component I family protein n=1 Tax=Haladaptatus salinisoli TaxID=2884876 RepID=UPI001D0B8F15|nr:anthranilate synthase component I family protein [Haladaptatus salinisoli]